MSKKAQHVSLFAGCVLIIYISLIITIIYFVRYNLFVFDFSYFLKLRINYTGITLSFFKVLLISNML